MLYIITCVWPRQTDCKWLDVSIGYQSRIIAKKLQVTSDDVIMTSGHLEMVTGKICTWINICDLIKTYSWNYWMVSTKNDAVETKKTLNSLGAYWTAMTFAYLKPYISESYNLPKNLFVWAYCLYIRLSHVRKRRKSKVRKICNAHFLYFDLIWFKVISRSLFKNVIFMKGQTILYRMRPISALYLNSRLRNAQLKVGMSGKMSDLGWPLALTSEVTDH